MTVDLTNRLAERGVPVIALTDSPFSPLSPSATVTFEIPEADYAGFRSLAATFCVAMALGVATAAKRNEGIERTFHIDRPVEELFYIQCA